MTKVSFENNTLLIGRYHIIRYLAAGGMQEVYLCHDTVLNREVVLKTPKAGTKDRRFKRGAEMGARINHSNVASTLDYYEDENLTFLIEEFISGQDLSKRMSAEFHYLDPHTCAHVIKNLAKALHEAHKVGICHRDLKPSNIMVSNDFNLSMVKLTDFGIAKLAESEIESEIELFEKDESTLTTSQTLLGAVPYMAPECWDDWKGAGQEMDIWSLGCIAYHLLSGQLPFGSGRRAIREVARFQDNNTKLVKPQNIGLHASSAILEKELWTLITNCIVADPQKRPTAANILDAFDSICYSNEPRRFGTIYDFGVPYRETGHIIDNGRQAGMLFFHSSEFYGNSLPQQGKNVTYSVYPGLPHDRCSTILLLK